MKYYVYLDATHFPVDRLDKPDVICDTREEAEAQGRIVAEKEHRAVPVWIIPEDELPKTKQ